MKHFCTTLLLLLLTGQVFAQKLNRRAYNNSISFSLFMPVGDNPGFEFGYERKYNRFSTLVSYTILSDALKRPVTGDWYNVDSSVFENYNGHRITLEQRYFWRKRKILMPFLGISTSWLKSEYTTSAQFGWGPDRPDPYLDTFKVHKSTWALSPTFGLQLHLGRLMLEVSSGFGVKWREVKHTGRKNPKDIALVSAAYYEIKSPEAREESVFKISVPFNTRVAFRF